MKAIIYKQENGIPCVIIPMPEFLKIYSVEEIAIKDVPAGKKFKIIDVSELPNEVYPQESWSVNEADLTDGIGSESNEFEV
jgi:hypothetical protein